MVQPAVNDEFKVSIFAQLVAEVNKIDGIKIDLTQKKMNPYKDALAFLVEQMTKVYDSQQSKTLLEDLVRKLGEKNGKEARWYLHQQVSTLYQNLIAEKCSKDSNWNQVKDIYADVMQRNLAAYEHGEPVEFGGINYTVLPDWYQSRYIDPSEIPHQELPQMTLWQRLMKTLFG